MGKTVQCCPENVQLKMNGTRENESKNGGNVLSEPGTWGRKNC